MTKLNVITVSKASEISSPEDLVDCFIEPRSPGEKVLLSSRVIASCFDKRHDNVIQAVNKAKQDCTTEFTRLNFKVSEYLDGSGRKCKEYQVTRDGFMFLGMSFTGKKAARFKEAIIKRFNVLEQYYLKREQKYFGSQVRNEKKMLRSMQEASLEPSTVKEFLGIETYEEVQSRELQELSQKFGV